MFMATEETDHRRAVRGELNDMLDEIFVHHRKMMDKTSTDQEARIAFVRRWELLNTLEEFLQEACVELSPDASDDWAESDNDTTAAPPAV